MAPEPITFEVNNPEAGRVTWTPPEQHQQQLASYPDDMQEFFRDSVQQALELFARQVGAIIQAGGPAETLFKLLNTVLLIAAEQSLIVMQKIADGSLPACGDVTCDLLHEV